MKDVSIHFPDIGTHSRDWLLQHPDDTQRLLAECKGRYPTCLCREPPPKLYIARRHTYYLARLPNSGPAHAPHCPSYEPDSAQCGRGIYSAIALNERPDGRISVKLRVPLLILGGSRPPPASSGSDPTESQRDSLKLRGLLHLLWETAGFNRWAPRMNGRRHYRQIHKYVLEAAERIIVRRRPLQNVLFMPEPFVPNQKLEIDARRSEALRNLSRTRGGAPRRVLLVAQLKELILNDEGCGLRLAHTPPQLSVSCTRELSARLQRRAAHAFVDWPAIHEEFRVMMLLTMLRDSRGTWQADDLATLVSNKHYVPVNSMSEAIFAKHLIEHGRYFYKPLCYDAAPSHYPNFLLTDLGDVAVPVELCANDKAAAAIQNARIAQYQEDVADCLIWDVKKDQVPPDTRRRVGAQVITRAATAPLASDPNTPSAPN